jgi:hypothetical protein
VRAFVVPGRLVTALVVASTSMAVKVQVVQDFTATDYRFDIVHRDGFPLR